MNFSFYEMQFSSVDLVEVILIFCYRLQVQSFLAGVPFIGRWQKGKQMTMVLMLKSARGKSEQILSSTLKFI